MSSDLFPSGFTNPATTATPAIYVSSTWNGTYTQITSAIFDRLLVQAASEGPDVLEFETPYGTVREVGGLFSPVGPLALVGSWVYLALTDATGTSRPFWGQVRGESRQTMGSDPDVAGSSTPVPKGFQRWVAYGGLEQLRRTYVSKSYWVRSVSGTPTTIEIGWTPGFNLRDSQGLYFGNRSSSLAPDDSGTGGSYDFGGTSTWTRRAVLDYTLKRFLNSGSGPAWSVTDPTAVLNAPLRLLEMGITQSVEKVLEELIKSQEGIDYRIAPLFSGGGVPSGYQIQIFTLTPSTITFGGASLPANGSTVDFDTREMQACERFEIAVDGTYQVARIRLIGDRILVCGTLVGPTLAGYPGDDILTSTHASLIGKWTSAQEAAYKLGDVSYAVGGDSEKHDQARTAVQFEAVYQRYGLPINWARSTGWLPSFDGTMSLTGSAAGYQDALRETLSWLPLLEGWDYTTSTPANNNATSSSLQDFLPPFVIAESRPSIIADATTPGGGTTSLTYATSHQLGLGHSALKKDLGLMIHASPNHRLARTRWSSSDPSTAATAFEPDDVDEPKAINANTLAATVAWRTDTRFLLEYVIGSGDDGTVVEVAVHDAQAWVLAPDTLVDVVAGAPVYSPSSAVILRNDSALFEPMMVGLIARYTLSRARVAATFHAYYPEWVQFVGQILHATESGASGNTVDAPITSLEMVGGRNGSPVTTIRAGFGR